MPEPDPKDAIREHVEALAQAIQAGTPTPDATPRQSIDYDSLEREQDIGLKGKYGTGLLILLAVQIVAADALVYLYAWLGNDWNPPPEVIQVWLGAAVVQVVGVVAVVVRYLFPSRANSN